ncbi:hypothetical protein HN446_01960 [bacterium]|nr:hypothetical protein [bacterium]
MKKKLLILLSFMIFGLFVVDVLGSALPVAEDVDAELLALIGVCGEERDGFDEELICCDTRAELERAEAERTGTEEDLIGRLSRALSSVSIAELESVHGKDPAPKRKREDGRASSRPGRFSMPRSPSVGVARSASCFTFGGASPFGVSPRSRGLLSPGHGAVSPRRSFFASPSFALPGTGDVRMRAPSMFDDREGLAGPCTEDVVSERPKKRGRIGDV